MPRVESLLLLLGLAACNNEVPFEAYRNPMDAVARTLPLGMFGIYSCARVEVIAGAKVIVPQPVDQCYKMQPQRRHKGIWLDQFEGSRFFEGVTDPQAVRTRIQADLRRRGPLGEWLGFAKKDRSTESSPKARLVLLDFVGRRTAYQGQYGHLGMSQSEVVVDRIISARPVYQSQFGYIECEFPESPGSCE